MNPTSRLVRAYRSPALGWARPLWRLGKRSFHAARNRALGGVPCRCGPVTVRVPSEYARLWAAEEKYPEPEAMGRAIAWFDRHPGGTFVDVGCSVGRYARLAAERLTSGRVIACDADMPSLAVTRRVCRPFAGRVRCVHGFVTDRGPGRSLDAAVRETDAALEAFASAADGSDVGYAEAGAADVPANTLDDLFRSATPAGPVLVKIDIEGAEGRALAGATQFLAAARPHLLVSVHPEFLPRFGTTADALLASLVARGYAAERLAVGHEEHWWFAPR